MNNAINHTFNPIIAEKYGINAAIIVNHLHFWIEFNAKRGKNFHEERTWTYGTMEQIASHFPYFTKRQVEYALKKLEDEKIIRKSNFNRSGYDRTLWYSFENEEIFSISQNCEMENTKLCNRNHKIVKTYKEIDTKTDAKKDISSRNFVAPSEDAFGAVDFFIQRLKDNGAKINPNRDKWARTIDLMIRKDGYSIDEIRKLIVFASEDEFWKCNVLSPDKLRKQAAQLSMRLKKGTDKPSSSEYKSELFEMNKKSALKLRENHKFPLDSVRFDINAVMVKINNTFTPIAFNEHGFIEQFKNALRKGGML